MYSGFEGKCHLGDMLGLQLAINPNLKSPQTSLFGGAFFEPVTGLSFNAGIVVLQGDYLRGGFTSGMAAPTNRSDYVQQLPMARAYFGVTLGYELFHTTAARLQATSDGTSP